MYVKIIVSRSAVSRDYKLLKYNCYGKLLVYYQKKKHLGIVSFGVFLLDVIIMLKSCKYCMRIHDSKYDCGKKPVRKKEPTEINRFRWSRKWTEKREDIKERDNYLCQVCKVEGRYNYIDLEVHHITPLEEDYERRLDDDNLITLCVTHHKAADRGEISKEYLYSLIDRS